MKPLPTDPFAFQARVMDALIADIRDPNATTFKRLDALRQVSIETSRESGSCANNAPDSNQ